MMKRLFQTVALIALAGSASFAEPPLSGTPENIRRNAVTSGGKLLSAGPDVLNHAVSQTAVSSFTGGGYRLHAGLMPIIAQPGSVVAITTTTKSTGTIDLAWSAPGRDGFLGDVTGGFYRIDYTSDPLHVFDPTVFVTEFSTTVVPGQPQSYRLSGLLPNTTYFARVYLADSQRVVAEKSAPGDQSTLANVNSPAFSGVWATSVTIAWTLPVGGAEGYSADASTTNFGALFPGGLVVSSLTPNGLVVNLTLNGLAPNSTFFFRLGSLNWQSELNFSTVLSTVTRPGKPLPIENLRLLADNFGRTVLLTWTNPVFEAPAGVSVLVSSTAFDATLVNGTPYPAGTAFADGSSVATASATVSFSESGLELDTTRYYQLFSKDIWHNYSVGVSTYIVLDLPPMAPGGLHAELDPFGQWVRINWAGVFSNMDGHPFKIPGTPTPWELQHFDVFRASGIVRSNWVWIGSTTIDSNSWLAEVPDSTQDWYWKIVSRDAFQSSWTDRAMAVDNHGNLYALGDDQVTRLKVPENMTRVLRASGNPHLSPILVRVNDRPQDLGGKVIRSVEFDSLATPQGKSVAMTMPSPTMDVVLHYETELGKVVPSPVGLASAGGPGALGAIDPLIGPAVDESEAARRLAAYYASLKEARKLYGNVDTLDQTVSLQSALLGKYQIRSVLRELGFDFDISGISNKVITPNGDGINDTVVFIFDNPKDSFFSGKIYDTRGQLITEMVAGPVGRQSLMWDGKYFGQPVARGVYLYQIKGEGKTFNGTVVVIR